MREYRRARRNVMLFLAIYFFGGLVTLLLPAGEIFPVYNWFLFALVPHETVCYELRLLEVNGVQLEPPRVFQEAGDLGVASHSVTVYQLTQKIGATNDREARAVLEKNWLPPHTCYEIVRSSLSK